CARLPARFRCPTPSRCCRRILPTTRRRRRTSPRRSSDTSSREQEMAASSHLAVTAPARRPRARSAESVLATGLCLLVAVLVLVPMLAVALGAMQDAGGISMRWLTNVLSSTRIIGNTLFVGVATTVLAVALGGALALILVRVDTPGRAALEQLVILPLYITPLLTAIAWSWLGSPRGGPVNLFGREVLGITQGLVN